MVGKLVQDSCRSSGRPVGERLCGRDKGDRQFLSSVNRAYEHLRGEVEGMLKEVEDADTREDARYGKGVLEDELFKELEKTEAEKVEARKKAGEDIRGRETPLIFESRISR